MSVSFDKALGLHPTALRLQERRTAVLTENIANSDTPNYKAKDFDFRSMLKQVSSGSEEGMKMTHGKHMGIEGLVPSHEMKYRVPTQASLDGNTVDSHIEKTEFTRNALEMQASMQFLTGRFSGLKLALKG
ncbi:MAG: flagellar basal body rod protein FlgB [Methylococcales bacterium]|nr:flagellar basal body rod protein FlgB [Methylococcales bacterium]MBT7444499.1 flagellar basal body rod protein FlgB [Methylococcales bacterium]